MQLPAIHFSSGTWREPTDPFPVQCLLPVQEPNAASAVRHQFMLRVLAFSFAKGNFSVVK